MSRLTRRFCLAIALAALLGTAGRVPAADEKPALDPNGDPLPPGARTRLGTARFRHGAAVTWLGTLPGGKLISTAGDGRLRVWDPATGKELLNFGAATSFYPRGIAVSPDGKTAATGNYDRVIRVWDLASGKQVSHFPAQPLPQPVAGVAFSPDGKTLASYSPDKVIRLWETATGKELRSFGQPPGRPGASGTASDMAFTADGKTLLVAEEWVVRAWDVEGGKELRWLGGHTAVVSGMAFAPDGKLLATAAADRAVRLWDPATGKTVARLPVGPGGARAVAFTPDGKTLATAGNDRTVRLWDVETRKEVGAFEGNPAGLTALAFSEDGKTLFTGGSDNTIRPFDVAARKPLVEFVGHLGPVSAVAWSPDGKTVATGGMTDRAILLWDVATGKPAGRLPGHELAVTHLAFRPDGKTLLSAGMDRTVRVWDLAAGKEVQQFVCSPAHVVSLAFSPDGKLVALVGAERLVRVWDVAAEKELHRLEVTTQPNLSPVLALTFGGDSRTLLAAGSDRVVRTWDAVRGEEAGSITPPSPLPLTAQTFAVTADGKTAVLAGGPAPTLLELATGKERHRFTLPPPPPGAPRPASGPGAVAVSPDRRTLATMAYDGTLRLWDTGTGKVLLLHPGTLGANKSLAFSPDGRALVSVGSDATVLVWDVPGPEAEGRLPLKDVGADQLPRLWNDLGADDAARGFQAVLTLGAAGEEAVTFLADRLKPAGPIDEKQIAKLIAELDADKVQDRERATEELVRAGKQAEKAVRKALGDRPPVEVRRRLEYVLSKLTGTVAQSPEVVRGLRAVEVLEAIGTPAARKVLESLAGGPAESRLTLDARAALARLEPRPSP
jgi:WD40 repeat protein